MLSEFRGFLVKSNALALAIGVIIGAALGSVVNSLVNGIIMPPIGYLLGGVDFASLKYVLKPASIDAAGKPVPEVAILWGAFINTLIAFVIVAFVAFMLGKMFIREEAEEPHKDCPFCKEANAVDATKCKACASEI
jgi:large conductance mechanosensitive channel